jgi:hypothetical protein
MGNIRRALRCGWLSAAVMLIAHGAAATAFSEVDRNGFRLFLPYGIADGQIVATNPGGGIDGVILTLQSQTISSTKTESGNATVAFTGPIISTGTFFFAEIGGYAFANPEGYAAGTYSYSLVVAITNMSGIDLDIAVVQTMFSAFNGGGDSLAAHVDNSALEYARYSSTQSGPGIGDSHGCDTRVPVPNYTFPSPPPSAQCGVPAPDFSELDFEIFDLAHGETVTQKFELAITFEVSSVSEPTSVPEPNSFAVFGVAIAGIAGLGALRRTLRSRALAN